MKNEKINKIAKKITSSYTDIECYYFFTDIRKKLHVCMKIPNTFYYNINECMTTLKNIKDELNGIENKLFNYDVIKKLEYIFPNTGIEIGYVFEKANNNNNDDAVIELLQNNGFQYKNK